MYGFIILWQNVHNIHDSFEYLKSFLAKTIYFLFLVYISLSLIYAIYFGTENIKKEVEMAMLIILC